MSLSSAPDLSRSFIMMSQLLSPFQWYLVNELLAGLPRWLATLELKSFTLLSILLALIGSSFVNKLVGVLTAMTAMWHDVFVSGERSAVQPVHAVTLQLLAVSRWIAPCLSPTYAVCWPSRLGALILSHSCALWTQNQCVRSNQGQALFSVWSPLRPYKLFCVIKLSGQWDWICWSRIKETVIVQAACGLAPIRIPSRAVSLISPFLLL